MQAPPAEALIELVHWNSAVIRMQTRGITQAESLLQPPFQGNCMNWVVGHILTSRGTICELLGLETVFSPVELATYDRGSAVMTGTATALELKTLLEWVKESDERICRALEALPEGALQEEVPLGKSKGPLGGHILFLIWHESYHAGQLELLRNLAGKHEKLI